MGESKVLHRAFYSPALSCEKKYCIYLPPSYSDRPDLRYSVLYLLPGLMDYEVTWFEKGHVQGYMDGGAWPRNRRPTSPPFWRV